MWRYDRLMEIHMKAKTQNSLLLFTGLLVGVLVSIGHGVFAEREAAPATLPGGLLSYMPPVVRSGRGGCVRRDHRD